MCNLKKTVLLLVAVGQGPHLWAPQIIPAKSLLSTESKKGQGMGWQNRVSCWIGNVLELQRPMPYGKPWVWKPQKLLTSCQGFWTSGAFKRLKKNTNVPSFCFPFSFKENSEEWDHSAAFLTCHTWVIPFLAKELVRSIWTHGRKAKIDSEQKKLPCFCFLCIFFKRVPTV